MESELIDTETSSGVNPPTELTLTGDNEVSATTPLPNWPDCELPQHLIVICIMAHACVSPISIDLIGPEPLSSEVPEI